MSIREATVGLLSGGGPSGSVVVVVGVVFGCTSTYFLLVSKKASGLSVGGIGAYAWRGRPSGRVVVGRSCLLAGVNLQNHASFMGTEHSGTTNCRHAIPITLTTH